MQCEVCGRKIFGTPNRAVIEGANMSVCDKCMKLSSGTWEPKPKPQPRPRTGVMRQPLPFAKRKTTVSVPETFELVADVGTQVRKARMKAGMSHDDLGRKIREKVSVLRKIESGKMVPDLVLAERLEHTLKITLRVPVSEPEVKNVSSTKPLGTTLGDLIHFKEKGANK
ncbi:MAG: multiprotein bridging factor aMBF1 [Candidatus Bathyarchaeota archaeon]|nr:multiprotein bridging factor aMBF1 [Candidatus Bathyarchaeota archaeon]